MKAIKYILALFLGIGLTACNNEPSLQEYYVENQNNKDFLALDVPASMFANSDMLNPEQQKTLQTIKKINVLAIPKKTENIAKIDTEVSNLNTILENEKYQLLMKYGGGDARVEIYFTGDDEAIDEIILYGFDEERGMGIARLLGDDMNPSDILNLMKSMQTEDVQQLDGLSGITEMFIERIEE